MAYEFADRRRTDARKETEDNKVETAPKFAGRVTRVK
jgi:hypothetical protein